MRLVNIKNSLDLISAFDWKLIHNFTQFSKATILFLQNNTCIIRKFQNDGDQSSDIEETSEGEQSIKPTLILKK